MGGPVYDNFENGRDLQKVFQISTCCLLLGVTGNVRLESSAGTREFPMTERSRGHEKRFSFAAFLLPSFPTLLICIYIQRYICTRIRSRVHLSTLAPLFIPIYFLKNKFDSCFYKSLSKFYIYTLQ